MPDLQELKLDLDIILYVCNIIENNIKQNETKSLDKKEIVVDIINKCTPLNAIEINILNKMESVQRSTPTLPGVERLRLRTIQFVSPAKPGPAPQASQAPAQPTP